MAKPTYKIGVTYSKCIKTMGTLVAVLSTGAGFNLIHSAFVPPEWTKSFKKESLSRLWTATKHPHQIEGFIKLNQHLRDVSTWVLFGVAPQLADSMLLVTAFIDCFIHSILLPERKFVPWNSSVVAIFTNMTPDYKVNSTHDNQGNPEKMTEKLDVTLTISAAGQTVLKQEHNTT